MATNTNQQRQIHQHKRTLLFAGVLVLAILALIAACGGDNVATGEGQLREPETATGIGATGEGQLQESETATGIGATGERVSNEAPAPAPVPTPTPEQIAAEVGDDTVQAFVGELRQDGTEIDDESAPVATTELGDVLDEIAGQHAANESSEQALAEGLAKRLGGEFTANTDLDVLLAAVVDQVGLDADASIDEVLAAVEGWANRGRIRIGGDGTGLDRVVDLDPAQVLDRIESRGIYIDALAGMDPIDLYAGDFAIAFDGATQTLTADGNLPAPFHQAGTMGITWATGTPTPFFELAKPQLGLAELLPSTASTSTGIAFNDVTLSIATDGVTITGAFDPTQIAGYDSLGLPGGSLPIETALPGLGIFGSPGSASTDGLAVELDIDLGTLAPYATWNTSRTGQLQLGLSASPTITYSETVTTKFGSDELTFSGNVELGSDNAALVLTMADQWNAPFGASWLSISNGALEVSTGVESTARITGDYALATKSGQIEMAIASGPSGATASTSISVDSFGFADLEALSQAVTGSSITPAGLTAPGDLLNLRDVTIAATFAPASPATFAISATTTVFGQTAEATIAALPSQTGGTSLVTVLTPKDVSIASLVPALESDPIASSIRLPESAIVWTSSPVTADAATLPAPLQAAFATAYRTQDFVLDIQPGLSLAGAIPPGVDGIDDVRAMLGMIGDDPIILAGTLPPAVFGGGGSIADLELRAMFPEVTPTGGPEWLVSGQVGLRITGQPSIGIVGALTMDLSGDIQTFEIEAAIAKTPTGVSVSLTGRLGNPWQSPFGMNGLTLNEVVLTIGLNAQGSLTMGFLGDVVVGTKDIRGAVSVAINPATGAPTNFAFEAQSQEGVGLGDMADLYALMSGKARPPVETVLPDIQFRGIDLRFAPQPVPELGIEQGFKIAGELWFSPAPGAPVEQFVAVDMEVSDQGIYAAGFLTSVDLGAVQMSETKVELAVSASEQRFSLSGGAHADALGGFDAMVAISRSELSFGTAIELGEGNADLQIAAGLDLRNPSFRIRAAMDEAALNQLETLFADTLGGEILDIRASIATYQKQVDTGEALVEAGEAAYKTANKKVCLIVCVRPCEVAGISSACRAANTKISNGRADVAAANKGLTAAREQLAKYEDIDVRIVGLEFEAALQGFLGGAVSIDLIIDAGGNRVPISATWDFNEPALENMDTLVDQLIDRYL